MDDERLTVEFIDGVHPECDDAQVGLPLLSEQLGGVSATEHQLGRVRPVAAVAGGRAPLQRQLQAKNPARRSCYWEYQPSAVAVRSPHDREAATTSR